MKQLTLPRLVVAITFISLFAMAVRTPADTDMYWHLRTGQYIVETRSVPTADPFSSTVLGKPWVDVHWLAQVILYGVYALFSTPGLALLVAALVAVSFVFVWKQMEGGVFLRAFILVLAAATSGAVWTARSQMATFVLTAALGYILYLYKWKQLDRLWLVPVLFVVWVNMHGGYISGFILLGAMIAGETVSNLIVKFSNQQPTSAAADSVLTWPRLRKLILVALISGAVLLVNPYTIGAVLLPFKTVNIGALQNFIEEWASPNFHELFQQPMVWMLLLTLVVIGWSGRKLDVTDAATLVIFAYISFLARRNIGLFALVCAPILARHADALFKNTRWGNRRLSRGSPILNWIMLSVIVLAAAIKIIAPITPAMQAKAEAAALPVAATNWIIQHQPAGTMFNSYNWGGYLLWRLWPQYPVYVDGRTDVYSDDFLQEYLQVVTAQPEYESILDRRGVGFIVVEKDSLLPRFLASSDRWQLAYSDDQAVIYVRRVNG